MSSSLRLPAAFSILLSPDYLICLFLLTPGAHNSNQSLSSRPRHRKGRAFARPFLCLTAPVSTGAHPRTPRPPADAQHVVPGIPTGCRYGFLVPRCPVLNSHNTACGHGGDVPRTFHTWHQSASSGAIPARGACAR